MIFTHDDAPVSCKNFTRQAVFCLFALHQNSVCSALTCQHWGASLAHNPSLIICMWSSLLNFQFIFILWKIHITWSVYSSSVKRQKGLEWLDWDEFSCRVCVMCKCLCESFLRTPGLPESITSQPANPQCVWVCVWVWLIWWWVAAAAGVF